MVAVVVPPARCGAGFGGDRSGTPDAEGQLSFHVPDADALVVLVRARDELIETVRSVR